MKRALIMAGLAAALIAGIGLCLQALWIPVKAQLAQALFVGLRSAGCLFFFQLQLRRRP